MRQGFVAALAGLVLFLASGPTLACETGGPPSPEAIRPFHPTVVALETLEVHFRVFFDRSEVEAVFTLRNTGPATTVVMGFAEQQVDEEAEPTTGMHDFRAFVDGAEVAVRRENRPGFVAAWYVWEVSFAAGQTRRVRYTCWSHNSLSQEGPGTGYFLTPAAAWYGNIGRVRVFFELASYLPYDVAYLLDPSYRFEGDNVVWECHDLEPEPGHGGVGLNFGASLFKSVHDRRPGIFLFYLAKKWEELSRAGSHEELLADVETHRHDEGMEVNPFLVPLYEARAQNGLGRTEDAVRNWHGILELTLPPDDYWRLHPAQDEAFYHLARYYHAAGNQDRVVELYEQLKRRPAPAGFWPPFGLLRWMESLLPPELTGGEPPAVEALLVPDEPPSYRDGPGGVERSYSLKYHARDPDGDLIRVEWAIWYAGGDPEKPADKWHHAWGPRREQDGSIRVGVRPGEHICYRVEAVDMKGNRGSTGILEYAPPAAAGPGDEQAALHPPRRSAWPLVGGGVLAAALGALIFAWRRRRARSL